ncbi:hypothetical protein LEMLEM_LOCUS4413 [Lemmus lemmus]
MSSFLTCRPCAPRTPISDGKTIAEPVTSPVVVPKVKFLEQMVRLLLALLQQLGSYGTTPGPMLLPTTVQFRPAIGLSERSYSPTYSFPEEIHPCSPQTGNQAQTDEDLSTPPIIGGCAQHSPCIFYLWKAIALRELDNIPQGTARLLEACLHSLLSFLTSNFPSNPLLPDPLFSIERLWRRFYQPPISTEEQVRPLRVFMRLAEEQRMEDPPLDAQRKDPTSPSARTSGRPTQGPEDA